MSLNAAMLRAMRDEGLSLDACIRILEAGEKRADPTNAARQARHRAKSNAVTVTRDEVTDTPPPLPPLKVSPDPFKTTPPISPTPPLKSRGCRLQADWQPEPLTGKASAMIALWNPGEMEREIAKFRNYWMGKAGKDACKADWQRTFINWLISADERKPRNGRSQHQSSGIGTTERAMQTALASIEGRGAGAGYAG